MAEIIQASSWLAQLEDGTKIRGGQTNKFNTDQHINVVPVEKIKMFTISYYTFSDSYYVPLKTWYKNGKPMTYTYPTVYRMEDGSILTVDKDNETGYLKLNQEY